MRNGTQGGAPSTCGTAVSKARAGAYFASTLEPLRLAGNEQYESFRDRGNGCSHGPAATCSRPVAIRPPQRTRPFRVQDLAEIRVVPIKRRTVTGDGSPARQRLNVEPLVLLRAGALAFVLVVGVQFLRRGSLGSTTAGSTPAELIQRSRKQLAAAGHGACEASSR